MTSFSPRIASAARDKRFFPGRNQPLQEVSAPCGERDQMKRGAARRPRPPVCEKTDQGIRGGYGGYRGDTKDASGPPSDGSILCATGQNRRAPRCSSAKKERRSLRTPRTPVSEQAETACLNPQATHRRLTSAAANSGRAALALPEKGGDETACGHPRSPVGGGEGRTESAACRPFFKEFIERCLSPGRQAKKKLRLRQPKNSAFRGRRFMAWSSFASDIL